MQKDISIKLLPSEAASDTAIKNSIARFLGKKEKDITGFYPLKQSIDARSRQQVWINMTVKAFVDEPFHQRDIQRIIFKELPASSKKVVIVGAGPSGLFAALKLLEQGIRPVILERGKDVRARRRDLAILNKEGIINPESNYCFGEGGAGTYSDGKLYTRSNKRGDINRILNLFVQFGAEENILYESHPHIGTNKLPAIITAMREKIVASGGIFLFEKKVVGLIIDGNELKGVQTADCDDIFADAVILATGHSARDIFIMLHQQKIFLEAKPFALGVRIEHPQALIDSIQYHCPAPHTGAALTRSAFLPPASYSVAEQVNKRGVFSFCMCPGGIIAPASTSPGELVVNGWSPSKRNNPFANSGMVVEVQLQDAFDFLNKTNDGLKFKENDPLLLMHFQEAIEQRAYAAGGGEFVAPAQRMMDFCSDTVSSSLPSCSYLPGIASSQMSDVLPKFIHATLQEGFRSFGKKMHGYFTNEAVILATESRTSSPVRIPRDPETLQHPQIKNLYPCGEGAGYAGGIVSAAMDGERVAGLVVVSI